MCLATSSCHASHSYHVLHVAEWKRPRRRQLQSVTQQLDFIGLLTTDGLAHKLSSMCRMHIFARRPRITANQHRYVKQRRPSPKGRSRSRAQYQSSAFIHTSACLIDKETDLSDCVKNSTFNSTHNTSL